MPDLPMAYLGIDPGKTGYTVAINPDGQQILAPISHKQSEVDLARWYQLLACQYRCRALIEQVGAMPGQGVTSMFNFGQQFGLLQGLLLALQIPFERIRPQQWQQKFSLTARSIGKLPYRDKKKVHYQRAQEVLVGFQDEINVVSADACLLAELCRRNANIVRAEGARL